ncbi:MAG: PadR family transcriptional regulator [Anaerolineaceae bacterium]|nr:PadR family transcriptional regulator [Anaerolineaceae bacterium]
MSLKYAILGFLSFAPMSGYDLKKAFDQSVRHFWPANQSQIYHTLAGLDEQGWVEKEVIPREDRLDMKIYSITAAGRAELHRWLAMPLPEQDLREPFLIQVYFSGLLSDAEVIHLLQHEIRAAQERIQVYLAIYMAIYSQPEHSDPRPLYFSMLTLEYGLAAHRALVAWAENAVQRIQAGDYSPTDLSKYGG